MSNRQKIYPARTRRNCSVEAMKMAFEQILNHGESFASAFGKVFAAANNGSGKGMDGLNEVWVAGRIIGILDDGIVLQDEGGRVELLIINYELLIGNIVEVRVEAQRVFRDGEYFIGYYARDVKVLAECGQEFFIKKDDPNWKRQIIDLNLKEKLSQRAKIIRSIREFFWARDFVETDTPSMVRLPGMEPYLDVFKTEFVGWHGGEKVQESQGVANLQDEEESPQKEKMYLITSPEYALKKLLVAGYEKIFQITKSFRNKETDSSLHNPEFTILEWYRAYANYENIMEDVENLFVFLMANCGEVGGRKLQAATAATDFAKPWMRLKVKDAFKQYAKIEYEDFEDVEKFRAVVAKKGYKVDGQTSYDDLFFLVFMNEIEPKLGFDKPVILYEYPACMAALSKKCEDDPKYAERFEVYINGVELCNAFTELNDPVEQKNRLQEERLQRQKMGKEDYPVDQSFIGALEFGMPPSGGIALGVDRLVMLLTGTQDIKDVLFFPHGDL